MCFLPLHRRFVSFPTGSMCSPAKVGTITLDSVVTSISVLPSTSAELELISRNDINLFTSWRQEQLPRKWMNSKCGQSTRGNTVPSESEAIALNYVKKWGFYGRSL